MTGERSDAPQAPSELEILKEERDGRIALLECEMRNLVALLEAEGLGRMPSCAAARVLLDGK